MKSNEKKLLTASAVIVAIGLLVWALRKNKAAVKQVTIGTAENGTPVVATMPIDTPVVNAATVNNAGVVQSSGVDVWAGAPQADANNSFDNTPISAVAGLHFMSAAGGGDKKWVVGGYNAAYGGTYVFPEGNLSGGVFVPGHLNAAQGSVISPSSYLLSL